MQTSELLEKAWSYIDRPKKWMQGEAFDYQDIDKDGNYIGITYCSVGSIQRVLIGEGYTGEPCDMDPEYQGASHDTYAATWDQWGIWIASLFEIDPDAIMSYYKNQADFFEATSRYQPKGMKAPWLNLT